MQITINEAKCLFFTDYNLCKKANRVINNYESKWGIMKKNEAKWHPY